MSTTSTKALPAAGRGSRGGRRAVRRRALAAGFLALWAAAALGGCGGGGGPAGGAPAPTNQAPRAKFQPDRLLHLTDETYSFDPAASTDADGAIVKYQWDFRYDGRTLDPDFLSTTPEVVTTAYSFPGTYTVALEVTDDMGATDLTTFQVVVADHSDSLQVIPAILDFGTPDVGDAVDGAFYFYNGASQVINVTEVASDPDHPEAVPGALPLVLPVNPQEAVPVPVTFKTFVTAPVSGNLTVDTDDPAVALSVGFTGTGRSGFAPVGPMSVARKSHTATRLPDGRVLIVGGEDNANRILASCEIYDPNTHAFTPAPSLSDVASHNLPFDEPPGRSHHTATLLSDGTVLVAGGVYTDPATGNQKVHRSGVVYNSLTDQWEYDFPLQVPRTQHVAVRMAPPSGVESVVLIGGKHGLGAADVLDSVEVLTGSGTLVNTGTLSRPRLQHAAVVLDGRHVLVAGGVGDVNGATASAEVFDIVAGTTVTLNLDLPRYDLTLTEVQAATGAPGFLAVGGGNLGVQATGAVAGFQGAPTASFSQKVARLAAPRRRHAAVDLGGGNGLLVMGGIGPSNLALDGAEIVAPDGSSVVTVADRMNVARGGGQRAALLDDGSVLVTGGVAPGRGGAVEDAELYVPPQP